MNADGGAAAATKSRPGEAVTGLEVHARATVLDGRAFGSAGAYEKIAGTIRFAADPAHPRRGASSSPATSTCSGPWTRARATGG